MRVIFCNIQLFSCDQMIYVIEDGQQIHARKVDIEDVVPAICALAGEFNATQIKLHGQNVYANAWAEEIKTAYALNYGNNNIDIEVI